MDNGTRKYCCRHILEGEETLYDSVRSGIWCCSLHGREETRCTETKKEKKWCRRIGEKGDQVKGEGWPFIPH